MDMTMLAAAGANSALNLGGCEYVFIPLLTIFRELDYYNMYFKEVGLSLVSLTTAIDVQMKMYGVAECKAALVSLDCAAQSGLFIADCNIKNFYVRNIEETPANPMNIADRPRCLSANWFTRKGFNRAVLKDTGYFPPELYKEFKDSSYEKQLSWMYGAFVISFIEV